jgi:UDP-glucose 4-epimerase
VRIFVTGGAGFIASNLVDGLLARGDEVRVFDNLSTGRRRFLDDASRNPRFSLVEGDLLDTEALRAAMAGSSFVFHLAANADVRFGLEHPRKDLEQNTVATFNVLEAMRANDVRGLAFSSTGSVYGEPEVHPTPEDAPFPRQTSLYGASKLAGEGLIQAYAEGFGIRAWIFRFVSILGERYSHGHVFDFLGALRRDPQHLHILGDGKQRKSYLYVQDCISAMLLAVERSTATVTVLNLGADEYCTVDQSAGWICEELGLEPERSYGGGSRGWVGDSPFIFLDCSRMRSLGWAPTLTIREAVIRTARYLQANAWLLEARS